MNNSEAMNWQNFKNTLIQNPELTLQFQYADNLWVDASYHITEIKQAPITSVDCGGVLNSWTEIILQLWEPADKATDLAMQVSQALSIVALVESKLQLNPLGTIKIEFGNSQFDTRQMYPAQITVQGQNLVVNLTPDFTQCKAINRGGSCGTTASDEDCCAPAAIKKPKIQPINLSAESSCSPGSGCC